MKYKKETKPEGEEEEEEEAAAEGELLSEGEPKTVKKRAEHH